MNKFQYGILALLISEAALAFTLAYKESHPSEEEEICVQINEEGEAERIDCPKLSDWITTKDARA